jgi:hypothetical protein
VLADAFCLRYPAIYGSHRSRVGCSEPWLEVSFDSAAAVSKHEVQCGTLNGQCSRYTENCGNVRQMNLGQLMG